MTDVAEQAEWDSDNGSYLAGLKGVTIPSTAPSLADSPKRGRHGSADDALQADSPDIQSIFDTLNSMPAMQMTVESIVPPKKKAENGDGDEAGAEAGGVEVEAGDGRAEAEAPTMPPIDDYYRMPGDKPEPKPQEPLTVRMPELAPEFTQGTGHAPQIPLDSIPSTPIRVTTDFVVPETTGSDKDAIPPQRLEKARLVEQQLRAEHPDADDEFVSAIRQLVELNASDLHLVVNDPPMLRVDGKLQPAKGLSVWNKDHTFAAVQTMTNDLELERFKDDLELDISFSIGDLLRFRVNVYRDRLGICAALRTIPTEIKTAKQLDLDPRIADLAMLPRGLVLVCGPTGSGKSTTLAAMIDHINKTRSDHIITIEDPIEYVYQGRCSLIHQREVGADVRSFASALRSALREDPDVILVGEMRDYETISAAVTAAETGHLVMSTLHTIGAAQTIDRIIDVCPAGAQNQIRGQLAAVLRGVITQQLLPLAVGKGRCAATEILVGTDAVANLIREGKCYQIPSILQSGAALGMHSLNADLARLVSTGRITREAAERCATNKSDLKNYL